MIVLDDWQKDFMEYEGHSVVCTGRRVGKTYIHSRKACKRMLERPMTKVIVASLTEDQAQLIILFALDFLQKHYGNMIKKKTTFTNSRKITLKNGSSMIARPVGNTGDAIRGFEGNILILDEVSRFNELILTAATPILLTTGGEIWMCSTPFGKQGYFYESFLNKNNRFKVWHKSSEEVMKNRPINGSWDEEKRKKAIEFLEQEKKDKSELSYGQEYLGLFLDDLRRFYDDLWIEKVCVLKRQETLPTNNNYLGVDIARLGGDKTTYEGLHVPREGYEGKKIRQIEHHQEDYKPTTHTFERIKDFAKRYDKIGIDAGSGSLGVGIYDFCLQAIETSKKVVAMNNRKIAMDRYGKTSQRIMNEDFHDNLKSMGEHGEILLFDDDDIKNSFRSIQIEISREEDKISKVKIYGRDSHIVEGIKRAAWLAKKEKSKNIQILSV